MPFGCRLHSTELGRIEIKACPHYRHCRTCPVGQTDNRSAQTVVKRGEMKSVRSFHPCWRPMLAKVTVPRP